MPFYFVLSVALTTADGAASASAEGFVVEEARTKAVTSDEKPMVLVRAISRAPMLDVMMTTVLEKST